MNIWTRSVSGREVYALGRRRAPSPRLINTVIRRRPLPVPNFPTKFVLRSAPNLEGSHKIPTLSDVG